MKENIGGFHATITVVRNMNLASIIMFYLDANNNFHFLIVAQAKRAKLSDQYHLFIVYVWTCSYACKHSYTFVPLHIMSYPNSKWAFNYIIL